MTLIYVHEATIPEKKARTIQAINTCVSLANLGLNVNLVVGDCANRSPAELASFYGLEWPNNLNITACAGRGLTHVIQTAIRSCPSRGAMLFCRNLGTARMLLSLSESTETPLVYEAHKIAFMVVADEGRMAGLPAMRVQRRMLRTFRAESEVFRSARGIVCTSDAVAALSRTLFGRDRDVIVARNGGPEPVEGVWSPESGVRSLKTVDSGLKTIVYVGTWGGWKGTDTLLQAMRLLEGFRLVVVGSTAAEKGGASDASRVDSLPEDRLSLKGYLPPGDVIPFLTSQNFAAATITLPAAHFSEPFFFTCPLKLFQYLAAGIPVVASDVPAIREILKHRENALLVRPGDPESLAEGIKTVAFDRQLALTLRQNGLETARQHTWQKRAEKLASFFRELAPNV